MLKIFHDINEWRVFRNTIASNKKIGFVPTMGNLHQGHNSLLLRAKAENDITVMSIFVNPTQFNRSEDLQNYPHTLEQDLAMATQSGVDAVLLPEYTALYPDDFHYQASENQISEILEGEHRPGHFTGVLTVVLKLLMLTKPQRIYLGEKDFQQLQLIQGLAKAFFLETKVIGCETIRDEHGLALSSRNNRLTPEQLQLAREFPKHLHDLATTPEKIKKALEQSGIEVEYVKEHQGRRFGAVKIGEVRLIDNILLSLRGA